MDVASLATIQGLAATFNSHETFNAGDAVPPLWHWAYFVPTSATSSLDVDGHPRRGEFLPPVPLPRRMWAGSRLTFQRPIRAGESMTRRSTIQSVTPKKGRSGDLCFVSVRHQIASPSGVTIVEEQDIVYRDIVSLPISQPGRENDLPVPQWRRPVNPTPILLFRYSALTFNAHRIHYDRQYAQDVEGYRGLVVHGPLVATLLLNELRRQLPDAVVKEFSFRAVGPIFDTGPLFVCGAPTSPKMFVLWAESSSGTVALIASANIR